MPAARDPAALIGPGLVAITLLEALNLRIFADNAPAAVYLNGTILFVAGLAIIRAHNLWDWRWPLAVTLRPNCSRADGTQRLFGNFRVLHLGMLSHVQSLCPGSDK